MTALGRRRAIAGGVPRCGVSDLRHAAVSVLGWGGEQGMGAFGQVAAFADLPFAVGFYQAGADQAQRASCAETHRSQGASGRVRWDAEPGPN